MTDCLGLLILIVKYDSGQLSPESMLWAPFFRKRLIFTELITSHHGNYRIIYTFHEYLRLKSHFINVKLFGISLPTESQRQKKNAMVVN